MRSARCNWKERERERERRKRKWDENDDQWQHWNWWWDSPFPLPVGMLPSSVTLKKKMVMNVKASTPFCPFGMSYCALNYHSILKKHPSSSLHLFQLARQVIEEVMTENTSPSSRRPSGSTDDIWCHPTQKRGAHRMCLCTWALGSVVLRNISWPTSHLRISYTDRYPRMRSRVSSSIYFINFNSQTEEAPERAKRL